MSELNFFPNKNNILNSKIKSKLDEKSIRKIRKTLLSLTKKDLKSSKLYNIIFIKNDENENRMPMPITLQKNRHEDLESVNLIEINIENEVSFDLSELANSSDFENEDDE